MCTHDIHTHAVIRNHLDLDPLHSLENSTKKNMLWYILSRNIPRRKSQMQCLWELEVDVEMKVDEIEEEEEEEEEEEGEAEAGAGIDRE